MCHNGNLRWKTWREYRHMLVCQSTLASTRGVVEGGQGGKQRRFLGHLFRTCMYKYPWKATFREPANQLNQPANQSHTVPDIPQPSFPPKTFPRFLTASPFDSISTCYLPSFTSKLETLQVLVAGSPITYALWSAFFFFKREKKNILLIKII